MGYSCYKRKNIARWPPSHQPVACDMEADHTAIAELVEQFIMEQELAQKQMAQLFTHLAALLLWQPGGSPLNLLFCLLI